MLYLFLLVKCFYWLNYYNLLFGANSIVYTKTFDMGMIKGSAFFLYNQTNIGASLCFIISLGCLCVLNLFRLRIHFLFDFIIWFVIVNIHNKIYPALTGGEYLLNQLLFFNIFISDKFRNESSLLNEVKKCLHNFATSAVLVQICLVYFFSAIAKLNDPSWLHGSAILLTSQVSHFSLPFINYAAHRCGFLFVILNYTVLSYQTLFPVIVWIKKIKKPFIIIGILMHLYIAFAMGLVSFGLIMILSYVYFWPDKKDK
jgi:hypothetical protein